MSGTTGNVVDPRIGGPFSGGSVALRPIPAAAPPRSSNPLAMLLRQQMQPQRPSGLLGKSFADPRTQAVLAAAGSLLGSSGYSRMPQSFGQSIGPALSAYNTTMTQQAALQAAKRQQQLTNALAVMGLQKPIKVGRGDTLVHPQTFEPVGDVQQAPTYIGTSVAAQQKNILLQGINDPSYLSSAEYAQAYYDESQPKTSINADGLQVTIQPDMSLYPEPVRSKQATNVPEVKTQQVIAPVMLKAARAGAQSIIASLDRFLTIVKSTSPAGRAGALTGIGAEGQRLNTAWANVALIAKGTELFNLGVLSGPDLEIIQRTLLDPSTRKGSFASHDAYAASVEEVLRLVKTKLENYEAQYEGAPGSASSAPVRIDKNGDPIG